MLKSKTENSPVKLLDEHVGENIGYDLGVKFVKDYHDTFGEGNTQFVGKNILIELLNQPGCIGISIYNALNEKGEKTVVLVGLDKENNPILNNTVVNSEGEFSIKKGIVADRTRPQEGWFDF